MNAIEARQRTHDSSTRVNQSGQDNREAYRDSDQHKADMESIYRHIKYCADRKFTTALVDSSVVYLDAFKMTPIIDQLTADGYSIRRVSDTGYSVLIDW